MRRKRNPDMSRLLEASLADATALSLQAKQSHWNVKGPAFQSLHKLFDKIHVMADGHADMLGERIVQLGGKTKEFSAGQSSLPGLPPDAIMGRDHASAMVESLKAYAAGLSTLARLSEDARDAATLDLASGALRDADKQRWFVEAHLSGGLKFNGRRNTDDDLRALEREAASGDPQAEARLLAAQVRAGVVVIEDLGAQAIRSRRPWLSQPGDKLAQARLRLWREINDEPLLVGIEGVLSGYIEAALWSTMDHSTPAGGVPLDRNYSRDDLSSDASSRARADVELFALLHDEDMQATGADDEQLGHDLWLTRNGHGAGFWDRGYDEAVAERLTEGAHALGEIDLVVGDDGKLHFE